MEEYKVVGEKCKLNIYLQIPGKKSVQNMLLRLLLRLFHFIIQQSLFSLYPFLGTYN